MYGWMDAWVDGRIYIYSQRHTYINAYIRRYRVISNSPLIKEWSDVLDINIYHNFNMSVQNVD